MAKKNCPKVANTQFSQFSTVFFAKRGQVLFDFNFETIFGILSSCGISQDPICCYFRMLNFCLPCYHLITNASGRPIFFFRKCKFGWTHRDQRYKNNNIGWWHSAFSKSCPNRTTFIYSSPIPAIVNARKLRSRCGRSRYWSILLRMVGTDGQQMDQIIGKNGVRPENQNFVFFNWFYWPICGQTTGKLWFLFFPVGKQQENFDSSVLRYHFRVGINTSVNDQLCWSVMAMAKRTQDALVRFQLKISPPHNS